MTSTISPPSEIQPERGYADYCRWFRAVLDRHYEPDEAGGYTVEGDRAIDINRLLPMCGKDHPPPEGTPARHAWRAWETISRDTKDRKLAPYFYISKAALGYIRKAGDCKEKVEVDDAEYSKLATLRSALSEVASMFRPLVDATMILSPPFEFLAIVSEKSEPENPLATTGNRGGCTKCNAARLLEVIQACMTAVGHRIDDGFHSRIAAVQNEIAKIANDIELGHAHSYTWGKDGKPKRIPLPNCPKPKRKPKKSQLSMYFCIEHKCGTESLALLADYDRWFWYEVGGAPTIKHPKRLKVGKPRTTDPKRDEEVYEAWKESGAGTYEEGANLLHRRFAHITAREIELVCDRIKARKRQELSRGTNPVNRK